MNENLFRVVVRLLTIGLVLAAIPESARDWSVWTLAGLILFVEFGIEPLDRHVLSRLPLYKPEDPEAVARSLRYVGHFAELAFALVIFVRVSELI